MPSTELETTVAADPAGTSSNDAPSADAAPPCAVGRSRNPAGADGSDAEPDVVLVVAVAPAGRGPAEPVRAPRSAWRPAAMEPRSLARPTTSEGPESDASGSEPTCALDPRPAGSAVACESWAGAELWLAPVEAFARRGPLGSTEPGESESADPFGDCDGDEPAEPPVSAATMGMTPNGATDVPSPRAMARAPTRPTNAAAPRPADSRGTFEPSGLGSAGDFASPIGSALLWSSCIRLPSRCPVLRLQISSALDQFSAGIKPHFNGESSTQSEVC